MANSSALFQVLDSFSRKNDVAAFTQDLTTAIKDGDKLAAMKALTDLANIFSGIAEATALSNQELARLGIDGNSTWVKIGNNYINPSAKFASVSLNIIEIVNDMAQNQPVKLGPVLGLIDDGTDALSAVSLRVGYVPLALGLKAVSITAGGLSVLFGESNLFQTHIPTVQQNLAAGKSPSGGVFGQVTDMGGKYAIYATKNVDGTMNELLIPMQGSTITDNRVASGSPTKYTYTTNGIPNQIEYEGSVVSFNPITGALIGSARTYSDSSYELLTGILSTTDFLSSSVDSDSNVFSTNTSKDKFGTIAGIRQAVGALSANERWGGQTFATASTNLGSYLGNLNYVDPSTLYQNTLVNSFSFNTNFGSYIPPVTYQPGGNGSVYIGPPITISIGNPVVLDLNQNGVELISLDESRALFDMSGTGFRQRTAWVAPSDALLAIDYNNDGVIKERKEINFVDWTNNPNLTDMEALALAFDTNKDGSLDSADADFSKFRVWQDKNADGVSDAGELLTLTQAGIKSIDIKTTKMNWSSGASSISGLGSYTKLDGSQALLSDSAFGHESAGWKAEVVNGIQRVINERGDKYAVAAPTGNFVVNLNTEGLNGAIGGAGSDSMTTFGATPVFMQGNAGNDSLVGGDGDDWLEGGSGSDSISGGSGDDTIIVDSEDNLANISGGAGFDIIAFEGNADFNIQLNLTNGFESAIGGGGNDNISVQTSYQIPRYWVRGNPAFNQLNGWADIPLISSYVLAGGDGDDVLTAGVGNDILDGGKGNDILYGDWGNDTYLFGFGSGRDLISEVYARVWTIGAQQYMNTGVFPTLYGGPNGPGVEDDRYSWTQTLGPGNNGLNNQSRNSDTIRMGNGVLVSDVVIEKKVSATSQDLLIGLKNDRAFSSVTQLDDYITVINGQTTMRKVETIEFSDGRKLNIDNWLQGSLTSSANDTLTGNASDNVLNGLSGADRMSGVAGNDIYVVDNINDEVIEGENQGTDTVETSISLSAELYANVENLTLVATGHIKGTGNSLANLITGNAGDNTLNGGAGNDTLRGGEGNDLLDGGIGSDILNGGYGDDTYVIDVTTDVIEADQGGNDTVLVKYASGTYNLASDLENMTLFGATNINGIGNSLNNILIGNEGNNSLSGGAGDDVLDGKGGFDTLVGGEGNDTYVVDTITDVITETITGGTDTVLSSVTYSLGANIENLILTGMNSVNGIGNALNNTITGGAGNNTLNGGLGSDTLIGGYGDDIYYSGRLQGVNYDPDALPGSYNALDMDLIVDQGGADKLIVEAYFGYYNDPIGSEYNSNNTAVRSLENGQDNLTLSFSRISYEAGITPYHEKVKISNYFKGLENKIEQIKFADTDFMSIDSYLDSISYTFQGTPGDDVMIGVGRAGQIIGGAGNDYMRGTETMQYFGYQQDLGNDIIQGMGEYDPIEDKEGNNILDGGDGTDVINSGFEASNPYGSKSILIGGGDTDYVFAGNKSDIILFNKGDGKDEVNLSKGAADVISLGGAFSYSDLSLSKSGTDLILKVGNDDQLMFKRWYENSAPNRPQLNLQVIAEQVAGFVQGGSENIRNDKVETFNFSNIIAAFDAAGSTNNWAISDSRLSAHILSGSNSEAWGGDVAYQYGHNGSLAGLGLNAAKAVINDSNFGLAKQTLHDPSNWTNEAIKLS